MEGFESLGYAGLFVSALIAGTIIPASSEVVLSVLLLKGFGLFPCLAIATLGNFIGGMTGYYLGTLGKYKWIEKITGLNENQLEKGMKWVNRYGYWIGFFCWLPIIGDALAVALGFLRTSILKTATLMFFGKAIRYVVWAWVTYGAANL